MTRQEALGFAAVAALALVAAGCGVAAGRVWNRRDWAARQVDTRTDLEVVAQVGAWPLPARLRLPPRTWRALTEARERAGEN